MRNMSKEHLNQSNEKMSRKKRFILAIVGSLLAIGSGKTFASAADKISATDRAADVILSHEFPGVSHVNESQDMPGYAVVNRNISLKEKERVAAAYETRRDELYVRTPLEGLEILGGLIGFGLGLHLAGKGLNLEDVPGKENS